MPGEICYRLPWAEESGARVGADGKRFPLDNETMIYQRRRQRQYPTYIRESGDIERERYQKTAACLLGLGHVEKGKGEPLNW